MAASLVTGEEKARRGDMFLVSPFDVIVREELRGRHNAPEHEAIVELALSMMENGQRQPVECRKIGTGQPELVFGFTRTAAARLIREGFENPETGQFCQDKEFKLKLMLTDANDKTAFIHNIVENEHRNATTPIDDAFNQHKLRDQYGYTDAEIKKLYGYKDSNKVARLKRLLHLPDDLQKIVHHGQMTVTSALDLLDLPTPEQQKEAFETVRQQFAADGKINGSSVRDLVRTYLNDDERLANAEATEGGSALATAVEKKVPSKVRSMRDLRKYIEENLLEHPQAEVQTFGKTFLQWTQGKRTDVKLTEHLDAVVDCVRG